MCGICGVVYSDRNRLPPDGLLPRMTGVLAHRGPDDQGTWEEGGVGLGEVAQDSLEVEVGHAFEPAGQREDLRGRHADPPHSRVRFQVYRQPPPGARGSLPSVV